MGKKKRTAKAKKTNRDPLDELKNNFKKTISKYQNIDISEILYENDSNKPKKTK